MCSLSVGFYSCIFILPSLTPGLSHLSRCAGPGNRGNQSDNASLMRYQAGTVRAGPIGTLDKHDNKESLEVRLRWRVESAMTRSIVDAIYTCIYIYVESRVSSACRESRRARIFYIGVASTIGQCVGE